MGEGGFANERSVIVPVCSGKELQVRGHGTNVERGHGEEPDMSSYNRRQAHGMTVPLPRALHCPSAPCASPTRLALS